MKIRVLDIIGALIISGFISASMFTLPAQAGILDDIKDAITGHTQDLKGRFTDDVILDYDVIVKEGQFDEEAVGQDAFHYAKGTAQIVDKDGILYVQLETDFTSGPLPDGHVYISKDVDINDNGDFNFDTQIDLGLLTKSNGAGYYEIPADVDILDINSVTIWCKAFSVYIGSADLEPEFTIVDIEGYEAE